MQQLKSLYEKISWDKITNDTKKLIESLIRTLQLRMEEQGIYSSNDFEKAFMEFLSIMEESLDYDRDLRKKCSMNSQQYLEIVMEYMGSNNNTEGKSEELPEDYRKFLEFHAGHTQRLRNHVRYMTGLRQAYELTYEAIELIHQHSDEDLPKIYLLLFKGSQYIHKSIEYFDSVNSKKKSYSAKKRWQHKDAVKVFSIELFINRDYKSPRQAASLLANSVIEFAKNTEADHETPFRFSSELQAFNTIYKWFREEIKK